MRLTLILLLFQISFHISAQNRIQHDFYFYDPLDDSDIAFNDVFGKYNLDATLSSVLIVWNKEFCGFKCSNLINRYASSNTEKFNLILVGSDGRTGRLKDTVNGKPSYYYTYEYKETTPEILKIAKERWSSATHLYLFSEKGGLDEATEINAYPAVFIFDNNLKLILFSIGYNLHPSVTFGSLYKHQALDYLKGSPMDVADYAFYVLQQDTISRDLRTLLGNSLLAEKESIESISFNENWEWTEDFWDQGAIIRYYYCLAKLSYLDSDMKNAEMYLEKVKSPFKNYTGEDFEWEKFGSVSNALEALEKRFE